MAVSDEPGTDPRRARIRPTRSRRRVMSTGVVDTLEDEAEDAGDVVETSPTQSEPGELGESIDAELVEEREEEPTPEPLVIVPAEVETADDAVTTETGPDGATAVVLAPAPRRRPATLVRRRRPRVRRVTRVIRSIDPWTVFKLALVVNLVLYAAVLLSFVLLWNVAMATGTVDNVERFLETFGWESFQFRGGDLYHAAWIIGLLVVVLATGLWVLAVAVFNLVTDLVGGIRVTVLEEEVVVHEEPPAGPSAG